MKEYTIGSEVAEQILRKDFFIECKSIFRLAGSNANTFVKIMEQKREKFCEKNKIVFEPLFDEEIPLAK